MGFEPTEWKVYCPECGKRKIAKTATGNFICSGCACEFRHNWKAWFIVGTPVCVLLLVMMLDFLSLLSVPNSVITFLLVVCVVAIFAAPDSYRVVKRGHSEGHSSDKSEAPH
jgi:hypothetical protein